MQNNVFFLMFAIISQVIEGFFKSLFDNVLDFIGQHSLYVLSTDELGIP